MSPAHHAKRKQRRKQFVLLLPAFILLWLGTNELWFIHDHQSQAKSDDNTISPSPSPIEKIITPEPTVSVSAPTPLITPTPTPEPEPIRITINAVGDVMCHDAVLRDSFDKTTNAYSFASIFQNIAPSISQADLSIANLETTIAGEGMGGYTGFPKFNSPEALLLDLKNAGFDVLTTANNHCLDRGWDGLVSTKEHIEAAGLAHTGTYMSQEDADAPLILDVKGIKVSILAYTYGTNGLTVPKEYRSFAVKPINLERIKQDIQTSRSAGADVVLVTIHWGEEYSREPAESTRNLAREIITAGADAILGSHPHVLQTIERMTVTHPDGKQTEGIVIYSLGNFLSSQRALYRDSGVIVNLTFEKKSDGQVSLSAATYVPTWIYIRDHGNFDILPIGQSLDDPAILDGRESSRSHLQKVWNDTTTLLRSEAATPVRK